MLRKSVDEINPGGIDPNVARYVVNLRGACYALMLCPPRKPVGKCGLERVCLLVERQRCHVRELARSSLRARARPPRRQRPTHALQLSWELFLYLGRRQRSRCSSHGAFGAYVTRD